MKSKYNKKNGLTIYSCKFDVQVIFEDKSDTLMFKCLVNGREAGAASIEFDR